MCIVCILWEKGRITAKEADKALSELVDTSTRDIDLVHVQKAIIKIKEEDESRHIIKS